MSSGRALLSALLLVAPALASGQAWTPPAGQGTVWLSLQAVHSDAHLPSNGILTHDVNIRGKSATLGVEYGLTDRLAFGINLPYASSRLVSGDPHYDASRKKVISDDGRSHGSLTDLSVDLRYKAIDSSLVFTPLVAALIPARNYEAVGHAAPGRGTREYSAGFALGHNAIWLSPSLFVGGGYRYTYVERIDEDITVDRSNADVQVDYLVTSRLGFRAAGMWQRTHGGLESPLASELRAAHKHDHDQLTRANYWRSSLGLSFGLTPTVDLVGSWSMVLRGVNTHAFRAWTGGVAWRFDAKSAHSRVSSSEPGKLSER